MSLDKQEIAKLVHDGKTYQEIANQMGRSRERIRQIADRMGLNRLMLQRREEKRWLKGGGRISPKYGMPMEKVRMLIQCGATRAYTYQKNSAAQRGIEWLFTLESWWEVWQSSGRWSERGIGGTSYVMARHGDVGPYSPQNVRICTCGENSKEMQFVRKQLRKAAI